MPVTHSPIKNQQRLGERGREHTIDNAVDRRIGDPKQVRHLVAGDAPASRNGGRRPIAIEKERHHHGKDQLDNGAAQARARGDQLLPDPDNERAYAFGRLGPPGRQDLPAVVDFRADPVDPGDPGQWRRWQVALRHIAQQPDRAGDIVGDARGYQCRRHDEHQGRKRDHHERRERPTPAEQFPQTVERRPGCDDEDHRKADRVKNGRSTSAQPIARTTRITRPIVRSMRFSVSIAVQLGRRNELLRDPRRFWLARRRRPTPGPRS
jgi:hypothetical protein